MYVNRHAVSPSKLCVSCSLDSDICELETALPQKHVSNALPQSLETAISKKYDVSNTTIPSIVFGNQYSTSMGDIDLEPAPLSESVLKALRNRPQKSSLARLVSFHSSNGDNKDNNFVDVLLSLVFMPEQKMKMDCSEYGLDSRPLKEALLPRDLADTDVEKKSVYDGKYLTNDDDKSIASWSNEIENPYTLKQNNDIGTELHHPHHDVAMKDALAEFDQVVLPSFQKRKLYGLKFTQIKVSAVMENLHIKHNELVVPLHRAVKRSQKSQKKVWEIEKNLNFTKRRHFEIIRDSVRSRKKMMAFTREMRRASFQKPFTRTPKQRNLRAQSS